MPAAAFADSQYLRGTGCVSKTSDNEDATATLGDSEESRVQYSPGDAIPELPQAQKYSREVSSVVGGKESGNILNDRPSWPQFGQHPLELKPETAALAPKTGPLAGHTEILAGEAAVDEINTVELPEPSVSSGGIRSVNIVGRA